MPPEPETNPLSRTTWIIALLLAAAGSLAPAREWCRHNEIPRLNARLHGHIVDYTNHSGQDRRLWSPALCQKRDMYVYLPPGFDCSKRYPAMLWLHGVMEDEEAFIDHVVVDLDRAICRGDLPPLIVVAPDGSLSGKASWFSVGSFFINSDAGRFEDYVMQDVWPFLLTHYPVRPERQAHVLVGASMGGFGAYNLAMKYPDQFKIVIGILPPLNLRWLDCHGRYMSKFDPCCWGWRTSIGNGNDVVGRYLGIITFRLKRIVDPLFCDRQEAIESMSRENPIELLDRLNVPNGLFDMYIAYAGHDEFNIDAQVESFLYVAQARGLEVKVAFDPRGHHTPRTAKGFFEDTVRWLAPRLAPFEDCEDATVIGGALPIPETVVVPPSRPKD